MSDQVKLRSFVAENPEKAYWMMRDITISLLEEGYVRFTDLTAKETVDRRMLHYILDGKDSLR
jgi:hypothetical protein